MDTHIPAKIPQGEISRTVIITGANGFIGLALHKHLREGGLYVIPLKRQDLQRKRFTELRKFTSAQIIHLAASTYGTDQSLYKNNILATIDALQLAREIGCSHFILASSIHAAKPYRNPYAASKKVSETLIEGSGIPYTILRPGQVYGSGEQKHVGFLLDQILSHAIIAIPSQRLHLELLFINDLLKVFDFILQNPPQRRTINVVGPDKLTLRQLVKHIEKKTGRHPVHLRLPLSVYKIILWSLKLVRPELPFSASQVDVLFKNEPIFDLSWAELTGVTPTPFKKGLESLL